MVELPLRLLDLGLRLAVFGRLLDVDVGRSPPSLASCTWASNLRDSRLRVLARSWKRAVSKSERDTSPRLDQLGAALEVGGVELHLRLLGVDVAQHPLIVLLHRLHAEADLHEVGLGAIQRDLELARIEAHHHVALVDELALMHRHRRRRCR